MTYKFINKSYYQPIGKNIWTGRPDIKCNEQYFDIIKIINLNKQKKLINNGTTILGFCSDEGINRNHGRIGSLYGPDSIRRSLASLYTQKNHIKNIYDLGNLICKNIKLELLQDILSKMVSITMKHKNKSLIFGGGHEVSFGHYIGIKNAYKKEKIGIINFDAHFDLRSTSNENKSTSGTSFNQIFNYTKENNYNFNYQVIGIQKSANSKNLFLKAKKINTSVILAEEININNRDYIVNSINTFFSGIHLIYITFCMDVFSSAFAPGVSSPQILGIFPSEAIFLLKYILKNKNIIGMDIAEVSPRFDQDNKTSKLAARLAWEFLEHN